MGILGQFLIAGSWLAPVGLAVFTCGVIVRVLRRRWAQPARLLRTWGAGACIEGILLVWFFFSNIDNAPEAELTTYLVLLVLVPSVALLRTILLVRRPQLTIANVVRRAAGVQGC
jgi:hypothetical protein